MVQVSTIIVELDIPHKLITIYWLLYILLFLLGNAIAYVIGNLCYKCSNFVGVKEDCFTLFSLNLPTLSLQLLVSFPLRSFLDQSVSDDLLS